MKEIFHCFAANNITPEPIEAKVTKEVIVVRVMEDKDKLMRTLREHLWEEGHVLVGPVDQIN